MKYECIGGHPEYAIRAGEFFFASVPVKPQKRRRAKDVVCE